MAAGAKQRKGRPAEGQAHTQNAVAASSGNERGLSSFLRSIGMSDHLELLMQNEMDINTLRLCAVDDLVQLGLSPLDAGRITREIAGEAGASSPSVSSSDEDDDEGAGGQDAPVVFRCIKRAALRKGLSLFSDKADLWLEPGDLVAVFDSGELVMNEAQITRVRCKAGWASVTSMAGAQLLEPVEVGAKPTRFTGADDPDSQSDLLKEAEPSCCMVLLKLCLVLLALVTLLGKTGVIDTQQILTEWLMWAWYKYGSAAAGSTNAAILKSGAPPPQPTPDSIDPLFSTNVFYPGIGSLSIIGNTSSTADGDLSSTTSM